MHIRETTRLIDACTNGGTNMVKKLLRDGYADPAYNNNEAMRCALNSGHTDIMCLLQQDYRINPEFRNTFLLRHACLCRNMKILDMLLEYPHILWGNDVAIALIPRHQLADARSRWYENRARALSELHTELVATVATVTTISNV